MADKRTEPKRYTVFSMTTLKRQVASLQGDMELPAIIRTPNNPRLSLDGTRGIASGIFENAPYAKLLTQSEAEKLMSSPDWCSQGEIE